MNTNRRYALTDSQWERIKDLLPGRAGYVGVTAKNNGGVLKSVLIKISKQKAARTEYI